MSNNSTINQLVEELSKKNKGIKIKASSYIPYTSLISISITNCCRFSDLILPVDCFWKRETELSYKGFLVPVTLCCDEL